MVGQKRLAEKSCAGKLDQTGVSGENGNGFSLCKLSKKGKAYLHSRPTEHFDSFLDALIQGVYAAEKDFPGMNLHTRIRECNQQVPVSIVASQATKQQSTGLLQNMQFK